MIEKDAGPARLETILRVKRASGNTFTGWASTNDLDLAGDICEPTGAVYETPLPLLWQHSHADPVGVVEAASVTGRGVRVTFRLLPEVAKAREAVALIEAGALALSIGFLPLESTPLPGGGRRFTKWRWTELSVVSVACNPAAKIDRIGKCLATPVERALAAPPPIRLSDAAARVMAAGGSELQGFYATYDLAVERLPATLRSLADVRRTDRDPKTLALTFRDSLGRTFATVTDAGQVRYPGQPEGQRSQTKPAPKATKAVAAGMTRGQQEVVIKHVRRLDGHITTLAEVVTQLARRVKELEAAPTDHGLRLRGFWRGGTTAQPGDIFTHDGSSFAARLPTDETPSATSGDWQLIARRGGNAR